MSGHLDLLGAAEHLGVTIMDVARYFPRARQTYSIEDLRQIPLFRPDRRSRRCMYAVQRIDTGAIKVGIATDLRTRLKSLRSHNDGELQLLASWPAMWEHEQTAHRFLAPHRKRGEWYHPTPEVIDWVQRQINASKPAERSAAPPDPAGAL